ncbi:trehalose hydrolase [Lactobacillus kitasatonis]|nr:trehalose hydrolase [Lactobacillus kitasatonis]
MPEKYQGKDYQVLLINYDAENGKLTDEITLAPYEALAIKIK